jgi:hypothetical protein
VRRVPRPNAAFGFILGRGGPRDRVVGVVLAPLAARQALPLTGAHFAAAVVPADTSPRFDGKTVRLSGAGMGSVGAFARLGAFVFGCDVSYAQLCALPAVAGSFQTRCWREADSNSWSRFEKTPSKMCQKVPCPSAIESGTTRRGTKS